MRVARDAVIVAVITRQREESHGLWMAVWGCDGSVGVGRAGGGVCRVHAAGGEGRGAAHVRSGRGAVAAVWAALGLAEGVGVYPAAGSVVWWGGTGVVVAQAARARTTARLRTAVAEAVEDGRDQDEVATSFGVSWPTVTRVLIAYEHDQLGQPEPTTVLGLDETRFGRPRWRPGPARAGRRAHCRRGAQLVWAAVGAVPRRSPDCGGPVDRPAASDRRAA